ncbi:MAG: YabP/YqfC family sporulation protein [Clostridia bacterium]|nr:YabP/YqfC family sporulation protein [Clostridia bacterium]MBQ7788146.1 YabP/YqfC family sporulation protein [Clostridia bacterium]
MHKKKLEEIISDKFDIPLEGISNVPNAQFIGNTILNIDGCIGIKKYECNEIIIRTKDYLLKIEGASLSMLAFSQGRVSIRGIIMKYTIERVGKYD